MSERRNLGDPYELSLAERVLEATGVIVLVLDPEGRIVRFNPRMEELSGYRAEEARGTDWIAMFVPERVQERVRSAFDTAIAGVDTRGFVNPILTKGGHEIEVEWHSKAMRGRSGEVIGLVAVGQDVTERERTRLWLDRLIEAAQDALVTTDDSGNLLSCNQATETMFGYDREELRGQPIHMLIPGPHGGEPADARAVRMSQLVGGVRTGAAKRKNGEVFPVEMSVTEAFLGEEVRYGVYIRDISETVRMHEELVERERLAAIGATTAKFAHEVGNPVNSLQVNVQLLQRRLSRREDLVDDKIAGGVKAISESVEQLKRLLEDFRALSRRRQLDCREVDLVALVRDCVDRETSLLASRGVRLEPDLPADEVVVSCDEDRVRQVLVNLFRNAMDAVEDGGVVRVRVQLEEPEAAVEVEDNGAGIPEGIDVFQPFATTKEGGTGLGLAVARQLTEAHNGRLSYRCKPGATVFRMELPHRGREG